ncbi:MAG: hypothetical protein HQ567_10780, partial [Candidatus Nealsonbacteria bacterium]|nr:hypothetical protein [Candidatus Nealsonbacteria bacterium]
MTTDKDLEDLLSNVRLSTTAEQDERILGDALPAIDQSAVFSLPAAARGLRRHWRLSTAVACVLILLAVLSSALPRTPVEDTGRVREVAAVTEPPENPAAATLGTESANTTHTAHNVVVPANAQSLKTRARGIEAHGGEHTSHHGRGWARSSKAGTERGSRAVIRKDSPQTPAGEAARGEAVDGVQVRLRAKQSNWKQGTVPRLWTDVRNQGKRDLLVRTRDQGCELEVDGQWYCQPVSLGTIPPPRPLPPGRQYDNIAIDLAQSWQLAASQIARAPWKAGPEQLGKLTPGKHTVRVAFTATAAKNAPGKPFRAVSDPVEILIVSKSDEKVDATSDGKGILDKLKSVDAVYAAAFTASGKRPGGPIRQWKFTMFRGRIALEEEVVEITEEDVAKRKRLGRPGVSEGKPMLALRSTFFVGPTAQAKYDWVGAIQRYGPQDPWPENGPGPATAGSLDVVDPDAPTYMLQIKRTLWCLGRGYSKHITSIRDVSRQEDGRLKVAADGLDMALRPGAKWELIIAPDAEYLVRSAELVDNRDRRSSYTNSGLRRHGPHCVPEKGECQGAFISTSFEFQSASFEADVEFLRRAKATMQPPYPIHTDVQDQRRTPELYMPYDAGKTSPQGRKPDFDLDWEKEAVFDMDEVPASETKLRAVMGRTLTAAARKGKIKIHGRQYTALLAQPGTTTGSFDGPETVLLLTAADDPKHYIQSYEKHLGAIRTVDGKYYK